jgi:hypothetical protein
VIADKQINGRINNVYLNGKEDALWINKNDKEIKVYADSESVLQIIQQSHNNEWAIIITMPRDIEGRAEVSYMLFDLIQEEPINDNLKHILSSYNPGDPLYFKNIESKVYVINESAKSKEAMVELRHYFY